MYIRFFTECKFIFLLNCEVEQFLNVQLQHDFAQKSLNLGLYCTWFFCCFWGDHLSPVQINALMLLSHLGNRFSNNTLQVPNVLFRTHPPGPQNAAKFEIQKNRKRWKLSCNFYFSVFQYLKCPVAVPGSLTIYFVYQKKF